VEEVRVSGKVSVFLSYRRADAPYAAGRLADRLGERFALFMDIDIAPGLHFGHALTEAVTSCDVMLVLIGRSWLNAVDDDDRRRLDDPRDWVVQEIEAALARDVTVIPVLVDGARMPTPAELPPALESLGFRQAISLRHESFATDIGILIAAIEQVVPTDADPSTGPVRDRNVEQRLVNAWRQLRGEPEVGTTRPPGGPAAPTVEPAPTTSAQTVRALVIIAAASYLTLVIWSLPLGSADDLEDSVVPLVIMIAVTLGVLAFLALRTHAYHDRRHLWRSTGLYGLLAVPIGVVLAVVTKNVSSADLNPLFWLLLYAVALIPGGLAFAMLRARHATAALWPAVLCFLVAVSVLLFSAVQLS
jgi:hypothetical protein